MNKCQQLHGHTQLLEEAGRQAPLGPLAPPLAPLAGLAPAPAPAGPPGNNLWQLRLCMCPAFLLRMTTMTVRTVAISMHILRLDNL